MAEAGWLGVAVGSARFLALFMVAPVFAHPAIPSRLRMSLALVCAGAMGGLSSDPGARAAAESASLAGLLFGEVLLGLALGFATRLVFGGFSLMGEIVSVQGGLGAATVLDPASQASSVALASLIDIFAVLVFFAIDGHHAVLRALALSLEQTPVGSFSLGALGGQGALAFGVASLGFVIFEVAVRLALPLTAAMLLANLTVGILGRSIPQLNLMTVQLPALVGLTLLLIGIGSGSFVEAMADDLQSWIGRASATVSGAATSDAISGALTAGGG